MQLMMIIIQDKDSDGVVEALIQGGFSVTRMASTGGFLRQGNVTLMVGVEREQINPVIELLKPNCSSNETHRHAATIFVMDMPEYLKI
jgi:uncharacterized protein YaaQ